MNEQDFIAREQAILDARLWRQLRDIDRKGTAGRETLETLFVNGLIEFGGPTEKNRYNHHRLTQAGAAKLESLTTTGV